MTDGPTAGPAALELREAALAAARDADIVIMAAAVADYRPADVSEAKIKKERQGDRLVLVVVKVEDGQNWPEDFLPRDRHVR